VEHDIESHVIIETMEAFMRTTYTKKTSIRQTRAWHCILPAVCLLFALTFAGESLSVPSVGVKRIGEAMINAKSGDTVWVENGVYRELVFVKAGVSLMARNTFKAVIDGKGKGTVVTLSANAGISGFEIRNGTIGVFSREAGNSIINCRIVKNWGTGVMAVRHLPKIEDNIIAFNRASGIQCWDVRSTNSSINHNTIAFNQNHGIALGGSCDVVIENNMITFNERMGVKNSAQSVRTQLVKNNLFGNLQIVKNTPAENYSFDPKFNSPRVNMDFKVVADQPCCMFGSDNKILGSRIAGEPKSSSSLDNLK
jgi:Periplasmic copper-binding protein (NosD)